MALRYWLLILLLAAGWGSSFFFNEILLRELGPLTTALGRVGTGALGCWIWMLARRQSLAINPRLLGMLFVFALLQYAIPLAVYPLTQQYITSSAAGIVNAMTPVMVVLVSHHWPGGERMTFSKTLGVAFGVAGIVILALPALRGQGESDPLALTLTLIAPLCYGCAMNYLRNLNALDRVALTGWSLLLGSVVLAPLALGLEGVPQISKAETWVALGFIGFVLTAAAFILLFWLVPRVGGTTAASIPLIAPISSVLLGVFILKEHLLPVQLIGMAVILLGLLFIDGRLLRRWAPGPVAE